MLKSVSTANLSANAVDLSANPTDVSEFAVCGDCMREYFQKNKEKIRQRVERLKETDQTYSINVYKMTVKTDYASLLERF